MVFSHKNAMRLIEFVQRLLQIISRLQAIFWEISILKCKIEPFAHLLRLAEKDVQ